MKRLMLVCVIMLCLVSMSAKAEEDIYRSPGSIVTFGQYEQDNDFDNGPEPIEWIILEYDPVKNSVLMISRYGLDTKQYNISFSDTTWEQCTLRSWLNNEFIKTAFTSEEQADILVSNVDNSSNRENNTDGGSNTRDRVFLMSYTEVCRYFSSYEARMCVPTAYAIAEGSYRSNVKVVDVDGQAACMWWLRSPGENQNYAAFVFFDGVPLSTGVHDSHISVRPALWLNLNSVVH